MSDSDNNGCGCTIPSGGAVTLITFFVFFWMKMSGDIDWPWWAVTLPLWIFPAIFVGIVVAIIAVVAVLALVAGICVGVFALCVWIHEKWKYR